MTWPNEDLPLFGLTAEEADEATAYKLLRLRAEFVARGGTPNSLDSPTPGDFLERIVELSIWTARRVHSPERTRRMAEARACADIVEARVAVRMAAEEAAAREAAAREAARLVRRRALDRLAVLRRLVRRCPLYQQWEAREGRARFESIWDFEEAVEFLRTMPPARH